MGAQRDLMIEVNIRVLMTFVTGESGGHQTLFQPRDIGNMDRAAVEKRSAALLRRKHFVARRIINNTGDPPALIFQSHGNAKDRIAVSKVRGAIERVNVPAKVAAGFATAALFANQVMLWPLLAYVLDDQLF